MAADHRVFARLHNRLLDCPCAGAAPTVVALQRSRGWGRHCTPVAAPARLAPFTAGRWVPLSPAGRPTLSTSVSLSRWGRPFGRKTPPTSAGLVCAVGTVTVVAVVSAVALARLPRRGCREWSSGRVTGGRWQVWASGPRWRDKLGWSWWGRIAQHTCHLHVFGTVVCVASSIGRRLGGRLVTPMASVPGSILVPKSGADPLPPWPSSARPWG